ncbi:isocitrate lyase/PEP mutase family protein [Sporomusa acidovorans]|uniref:2,3-dimethylmalate lyase n=1 Tax=Sporomusa acidovorans (strain ATCC 49682 / DSM 3132 / Mol) TaxID=1123286 RepID=A0ABZ3J261_SPOA4|nr:isocitrate lyase/PEP mutase family protein [Sporomusa acidovorans]OZC19966.1 2,3-dimethylmalate lyase [Sporomusa acidovorans DSM 3132]SDD48888.1 2,3-dimethylmalate lyase [Sporomusa acidovorans]
MKKTTQLRQLLSRKQILIAPGAHDALTAKIIAKVGFEAIYFTGYGQAASHLGMPDVGLLTMTEMAERVRNFVHSVDIPVIADGDTGFGNAVTLMRTVSMYEENGAAAIQLEDQVAPKKCGHMTGRQVIPSEEMVGKIKAAVAARRDPDFVILARTDARTTLGIEEAIRRGKAYEEAGADVLFIESPENIEEMKSITSSFQVPVLANMVEGGRTPLLNTSELEKIGYNLVIYPTASTYVTAQAMFNLMNELKDKGTTQEFIDKMIPFSQFNELIGLPKIRQLEDEYLPKLTK